jgi:hypothetical protein
MPNKHDVMKLSHHEDRYLRQWMYDETHYQSGLGPAKSLQLQRAAIPADLAILIAAAFPTSAEQEAASLAPPGLSVWPWFNQEFRARFAEARAILTRRRLGASHKTELAI